jgi:ATP-dependent helicase HrpB
MNAGRLPDPEPLPIEPLLPRIIAALAGASRLVVEAPPGAGKTTRVALALLDASWLSGRIVMLEPRRVAARAAAGFMAASLGEPVGRTVGYRVRNDARVSDATRVEVVTEAILTRMLQDDPALEGVGAVLFDEFHERNLHADLGLALALDAQAALRPDLRLVVMSATLDGERLERHLKCPRLRSEGRSHPVTVEHMPARPGEDLSAHARRAIVRALDASSGDVLVFLPGKAEIAALSRVLDANPDPRIGEVLALHGELDLAEQSRVLAPGPSGVRRVVLATNVAESSVTLPGVRAVVDSGLAREPRFDPTSGFSRLETVLVSQASATQRAGRAGRVAPGIAIRLWPESQRLDAGIRPEIAQVELAPLALELALWGPAELRWLDPPPPGQLAEARDRLRALGAIDASDRITPHGRAIAGLGVHPRLGHLLLAAPARLKPLACDLAVLLEARDPLRGEARHSDDLADRFRALARWRRERVVPADADRGALVRIAEDASALRRRLGLPRDGEGPGDEDYAIGELVALAFPERIARADPANPHRFQLASGRGARLDDRGSRLVGRPWLAVSELVAVDGHARIQRAAPLDEAHLREMMPERFMRETTCRFDAEARAVVAEAVERFDQLVLARRSVPVPRGGAATAMLLEGLSRLGVGTLPWTEPLRQWQARVQCLAGWMPDAGLPDVSDEGLAARLPDWLGPYAEGRTRVTDIDPATLGEALIAQLDDRQRALLDAQAPVALVVPSGLKHRLEYVPGQAPVLKVKLQELFGLADTPRVGGGRVSVSLHLLSPAGRPIQVTQDLRGFWERTYAEVRKELKGRYPRHPWPDDPWTATPTARAKPRGT